ncbi:F-box/LRR-repeat protein At4g14103-like [Papaver somniferum]|uniref:F-box/LRR-repeat protein At4g14103-like n=1 Tax=Papaver somniferum TaxID=3469 RepID=UPI000E703D39|nr:F-box/LRR-repeat protein At4g14103-like [Papaver somniferum]XP_026444484.1 F-box/LRR-repeat protein At4g14103-like [Papaver somniferum]XP_026444485.1 F-box/LRR-repeat protein At4g14103-like [Papaver somniferum]
MDFNDHNKLLKGQDSMTEAKDLISDLPDSLLHHILSFLEIKYVARTSVLSKRWNYIWTSIPTLDFKHWLPSSLETSKFMDFLDGTLHRHNISNIQKFSLLWNRHLNESRVNSWISNLIRLEVQEFNLFLDQVKPFSVPLSLCNCASLLSLTLEITPNIYFPKDISFPRLKRLHLYGVKFTSNYWNEQFFSNCAVLEDLVIGFCNWIDVKSFCISNPTLKVLKILNPQENEDGYRDCALEIHAPNLESLTYKGRVAKEYLLSRFRNLVEAKIDFVVDDGATREQRIGQVASVRKFVRTLSRVNYLSISDRTLQILSITDGFVRNLPMYHYLFKLNLTKKTTTDGALIVFLKTAPNLEIMEFKGFTDDEIDGEDNDEGEDNHDIEDNNFGTAEGENNNDKGNNAWEIDSVATRCIFLQLKSVSFKNFSGDPREFRWVKLILRNARILESMMIYGDRSLDMESEKVIMVELSSLPRASASCVFKLYSHPG